jgi:PAS domain S-box-containing protein
VYTLLLIDDDPDVLAALRRRFHKAYNVLVAESGDAGISILKERAIDLIICDQRMPGTTGVQVLQHALQIQPDAVRILLTGYSDIESLTSCVNDAHIYRYLTKPWDPRELDLIVVRALESYELKRQLDEARLVNARLYQSLERKVADRTQKLAEALNFNKKVIDNSPLGIMAYRGDGKCVLANPEACAILGAQRKYLLRENFRELPSWNACGATSLAEKALSSGEILHLQAQMISHQGKAIWLQWIFGNFVNQGEPHLLVMLNDITESKQAEQEIILSKQTEAGLRSLADNLETCREEERIRIAREIHDELGSALTVLKMDLSWLSKQLPGNLSGCRNKTDEMEQHIGDAIKSLRRIINDLRPSILDHLGLLAVIDWQVQEFQQQTGIHCILTLPEEDIDLDEKKSTAVFRIMQAALANINLHAKATQVSIEIITEQDNLIMKITDNGCGMDFLKMNKLERYGIKGMIERARHFAGEVSLISNPGEGTMLMLQIPLTLPAC